MHHRLPQKHYLEQETPSRREINKCDYYRSTTNVEKSMEIRSLYMFCN